MEIYRSFEGIKTYRDVKLPSKKWKKWTVRDPSKITTLGIHHTGIKGGFGVSRFLLKKHKGDAFSARRERYLGETYHSIWSSRDKALILQWPPWMYTFHGNKMNKYTIGFAFDLDSRFDEFDPSELMGAVSTTIQVYNEAGCNISSIETHSQHSNKPSDPGLEIMKTVIVPVAESLGLTLNLDKFSESGKPWDPSLLGM